MENDPRPEIEKIDFNGHLTKIEIPKSMLQKFLCNCDKVNDVKLGDPCDNCKYRNY